MVCRRKREKKSGFKKIKFIKLWIEKDVVQATSFQLITDIKKYIEFEKNIGNIKILWYTKKDRNGYKKIKSKKVDGYGYYERIF